MLVAVEGMLSVARLVAEAGQLSGHGKPRVQVARPRERRVGAFERVRQCRRIVELASELDRIPTQRRAPLCCRLFPQRPGQSGEKPRPQRILAGQRLERVLEQRDQAPVAPGAEPHESPAVPEGGTCELLRRIQLARNVGGLGERLLPRGGVASPRLRVSQAE